MAETPVNVTPIPHPPGLTENERQDFELIVRSTAAVVAAGFAVGQVFRLLRRQSRVVDQL